MTTIIIILLLLILFFLMINTVFLIVLSSFVYKSLREIDSGTVVLENKSAMMDIPLSNGATYADSMITAKISKDLKIIKDI